MKNQFVMNHSVYRLLAVILCLCLLAGLTACGDNPATSSDGGDVSAEITKPVSSTTATDGTTTTSVITEETTATTLMQDGATSALSSTQRPTASKTTMGKYWSKTTKAEESKSGYTLKASDYIRNPQVHETLYFGGNDAYPHVHWQGPFVDSSFGMYSGNRPEIMKPALEKWGFYVDVIFKNKPVSEWAYSFLKLQPGHSTGLGYVLLDDVGYRLKQPKNRKEALAIIKDWLFRQYPDSLNEDTDVWDSCPGYYLWNHYAGDWGCDSVGAEVGESISHTQASIAFTRGTARQNGIPFYIDISPWYGSQSWGHSPSMMERHALASYMSGSAFVMAEGGGWGLVASATGNLNPKGRPFYKVSEFMNAHPNVGYTYTPFALVFDYYHGMYPNERFKKQAFGYFDYNDGDYMSWELLNMFFPGAWESKFDETDYLVNGPYGDTCDALLQNASQEVLNSYPCLILSGSITLSGGESNRYINYVKQGGTLVLNTAYLQFFPDYKSKYSGSGAKEFADGKGKVIVYGPDYDVTALDGIIKDQLSKLVPFTVTGGQIEHIINIKDGTMYVTLINNDGYTNTPQGDAAMDNSKTKNVTVTYTGNLTVKSVAEIYSKTKVTLSGKSVSISVKPGDSKVLEFKFD